MRSTRTGWSVWILSLSLLGLAFALPETSNDPSSTPAPLNPFDPFSIPGGAIGETSASAVQNTATTAPLTATTTSISPVTLSKHRPPSSLLTPILSISSPTPTTTSQQSFVTSSTGPTILESPTPSSSLDTSVTSPSNLNPSPASIMSPEQRTLIIVLSSVLGSVGLTLIVVAIWLFYRYKKGHAPFHSRGVSPINDEEIESWRGTEQKQSPILAATSTHTPRGLSIDSIALKDSPGSAWNGLPGVTHSMNSPTHINEPPSFVARAPNSRVGLTDEAVPGADAFIPSPKRQSSRLSKAPHGHARTKSRRSSMSAKSTRSYTGRPSRDMKSREAEPYWYDQDGESVGTALRDTDAGNSSLGTSNFDFDGFSSGGGHSPGPKSKLSPKECGAGEDIGRAIA